MALKLDISRFGVLDVQESDVIVFPDGMLGFPHLKQYILLNNPGGGPFKWLQSVEMPAIAFVVADPLQFFADYHVSIRKADLESIRLDEPDNGFVLAVLTIRPNVIESTANLAGPVVVNIKERLARQIVLNDPRYHTRHLLSPSPTQEATDAGADAGD